MCDFVLFFVKLIIIRWCVMIHFLFASVVSLSLLYCDTLTLYQLLLTGIARILFCDESCPFIIYKPILERVEGRRAHQEVCSEKCEKCSQREVRAARDKSQQTREFESMSTSHSDQYFCIGILTLVLLNCLKLFFIHFKLELLTQFPASNDEKYFYLWKIDISQIKIFY